MIEKLRKAIRIVIDKELKDSQCDEFIERCVMDMLTLYSQSPCEECPYGEKEKCYEEGNCPYIINPP
jgi:hypothetical protein